jgi:hypothetical protein
MKGIDGPKKGDIYQSPVMSFFRADIGLGMAIARELGIKPVT